MSERVFTITEMRRAGDGGMVETPIKFEWTNDNRAAPRGSWKFGVEQRTVRTDYPGAEEPVEQVLGPSFKEFSLMGCWDDRYNFPGFAVDTWRAFESLVQAGALVRLEFEGVTIHGIIKDADFDYWRASYIMYSFSVSPHYRHQGALARTGPVRKKTPEALKPPTEYRDLAGAQVQGMQALNDGVPGTLFIANTIKGDLFPTVRARTDTIFERFKDVVSAIDQRIDAKVQQFEAIKRVASAFAVIQGQCSELLTDLASAKSSINVAWDNAVSILAFDEWVRSMTAYARILLLTSKEANAELSRRVEPHAIALYKPHAGESLYGISQRFYGTPGAWRQIADRNSLTTLTLTGTETLIIPERR